MEKEALISALKEKAQVENLSERTIDEVATIFLPSFADDTKITDESWNLPVQMMKTMSGQLRHDLSGGINAFKTQYEADSKTAQEKLLQERMDAFKAEWEKTHPTVNADKDKDKDNQQPNIDDKLAEFEKAFLAKITGEDSAFGKLSKQFSDFMTAQAEREKAATETEIRSQIREYLLGRGVDEDDFALEYTLEKLEIGDKPDVKALKTKAEKDYEAYYKKIHKNDGGQPFRGGGDGGKGVLSPEIKSHIDRVAKDAKDAEDYQNSIEFAK